MIRKALVPIAGLGTRMYPLTRAVPKAMLPLPAGGGALLPVVHWICSDAAAAGVQSVMVILSPRQEAAVREYFALARQAGLPPLPEDIRLAVQESPKGFGDAVAIGEEFVADEPFLVLLGDHVYISGSANRSCVAQVAAAHERHKGVAMIGVQPVGPEALALVGVAGGEPIADRVYRCKDFVEKPDLATARRRLVSPDIPDGQFLAHCGIYVFGRQIFECLSAVSRANQTAGSEAQLASAQAMLLERHPREYFLARIDGRAYDTGTPGGYIQAFSAFAGR
jgi:UTP--glucose-1-phosphate uridylyltransferase